MGRGFTLLCRGNHHARVDLRRMMITCCNDGTRPVIFKIERIDIAENEEEQEWL